MKDAAVGLILRPMKGMRRRWDLEISVQNRPQAHFQSLWTGESSSLFFLLFSSHLSTALAKGGVIYRDAPQILL